LTHGIGFDRSYWDLPFNNYNYSYVAQAVDEQGYSTFAWDRVGIASSSRGDPVNEIQQYLDTAALKELSTLLRDGSVKGIKTKFNKFVHVGHSFGSAITYNFINENPNFSDAAILTGFSQNPNFVTAFVLAGNFKPVKENAALAAHYPVGYFAPQSSIGVNIEFFAPGDFDPKMLANAFATGQPATPGELLTIGAGTGDVSAFKGHLLIVTGG
jgi:pimeloyl-ACP methyl ester carboxylesterase